MGYIVRTYPDIGFMFDVVTQRSFFTEGTASQLLPLFSEDIKAPIPGKYLFEVPLEFRDVALGDAEFLRKEVQDFIDGKSAPEKHIVESNIGEGIETPFRKLMTYAVKDWKIVNASIEVCYRCNLNCRFCYLSNHNSFGMSREQYRNLADQLREAGTIFVMFTGGEAFLRPDIIEIMSDYHQKGFALELKTNGTLMDPKTIDCLRTLNIYNLQVSIYGLENGYSDLLRANYNFEGLSENIKIAIQAGLPIGLAVLVGKHNIDQLDRYHEVLTNLGVNDIFYSPYITPNRSGGIGFESAIRLSRSEMENKLLPFLYRIGGLSNPTKYRDCNCDGPICFAGHDQIAISPGGTIYPCLDFQLKLGNMLEDDLNSILARRKDILSQYTLGKMSKCMKCNIVEFCDSCPGTALLEHGDYAVPSLHKCDVSQFNLRTLIKEKGGDN